MLESAAMASSRVTRIWDRAVLAAATLWVLFGVTAMVVRPGSADSNFASQTTLLAGFFIILSVMFVPLYLYSLCLLVETLSRRR